LSLPTLERERLLGGSWKIRPAAGLYFKRDWCTVIDAAPVDLDIVGYWDLAVTEKTEFNDLDWTVGVKLGHDRSGGYWPLDMVAGNVKSGEAHGMRTCSAFSKAPQISPMAMRSTPAAAPWKCSTRTRRKAAQASDCLIRTPFCGIRLDALCA
jgi:hypothetical protein